jgi:hypothetical protein
MNSNEFVRGASLREVVEHFLRVEGTWPKYAAQRDEVASWSALDDDAFFERVRAFADARADTNPVLTWTIGTRGNKHHESVRRWVLAKIPLASLYSRGINPLMKKDLDESQGNLVGFLKAATKYAEFRLDSVPQGDLAILFAVAKSCPGRLGVAELLDGAHRALAMAATDIRETLAYVAEI